MERVCSIDEYKELLHWNKTRLKKVVKNSFLLSNVMGKYIDEERLYVQKYEDGIAVFVDEGRYYNLYYFWEAHKLFDDFKQEKPVLVEELNNNHSRDEYLKEIEPKLFSAGFELYRHNFQLEINLKDKADSISSLLAEKENCLKNQNLSLEITNDEKMFSQSVELWNHFLKETDVPMEHLTLTDKETLVCIVTPEKEVAATHWWRNTGKSSEGRHTVTHPDYYHRGLASTLLYCWCNMVYQQGVDKCCTWISDENYKSLSMYKKVGFVENGRTSKQYILK